MADAYIIETEGETAGIVVRERRGVRFFASEPGFFALDGRSFDSLRAAHRAVEELRQARRSDTSSGRLKSAA